MSRQLAPLVDALRPHLKDIIRECLSEMTPKARPEIASPTQDTPQETALPQVPAPDVPQATQPTEGVPAVPVIMYQVTTDLADIPIDPTRTVMDPTTTNDGPLISENPYLDFDFDDFLRGCECECHLMSEIGMYQGSEWEEVPV